MDKRIVIVLLLIIIAIIVTLIINKQNEPVVNPSGEIINPVVNPDKEEEKTVEVTEEIASKIKEEAYLNILLQIKNYDNITGPDYETLLEAAMRIAEKQGLYQTPDDGAYVEYVPKSTIHDIIFELTGEKVQDPIIIEDFFYAYNAENDYYYVVPLGANWMELDKIKSITYTKSTDQYTVHCSGQEGTEDYGMVITYPDIELKLKYKSSNKYIKYQLVSMESGKSTYGFAD